MFELKLFDQKTAEVIITNRLLLIYCWIFALFSQSTCYAHEYLCNSSRKALTSKFLLQQWINAQKEIGIEVLSSIESPLSFGYTRAIENVLIHINSCNNGVRIFYTVKGQVLPYITLWKCASDGITQNLRRLTISKQGSSFFPLLNYGLKSFEDAEMAIDVMKNLKRSNLSSLAGNGFKNLFETVCCMYGPNS